MAKIYRAFLRIFRNWNQFQQQIFQ